ncbi:MAG: alanine--tRNA ligase [Candidatus Paceibacterota bacterium]|jgi:alanyl-tRNA synthetase
MKSQEIRSRFLAFFEKRKHVIIPSASLVTSDEKGVTDSTLFNAAGMQPLVPYLLGKPHPMGKRLANVQKVLRTVDIDEIGDNTHATFFEMLGNWSLGDYFKEEAINWSYEFLTSREEGLGLDPERLYITVFEGDHNAPKDDEAANIWRKIYSDNHQEVEKEEKSRIFFMPASSNWWQAGENGPCGPDTEMYYDIGNKFAGKHITKEQFLDADSKREVVEIWNDVFMQYEKIDGKIVGSLPNPSVDTGAGLERVTMTMQNVSNIYDTDLFLDIMSVTKKWSGDRKSQRIIADHIRAAVFLITDRVVPSNTDRGYVLRRLIRKAIFHTDKKSINEEGIDELIDAVIRIYGDAYPDLSAKSPATKKVLADESAKFTHALEEGSKEFEKLATASVFEDMKISGKDAFMLFSSYGLPIDMTVALAKEKDLIVDVNGYNDEYKKHQELSRAGAEKKFKGGLSDVSDEMVLRYHTATHLLHQALHDVLGPGVMQKGSNITPERLRFDFAHSTKMTEQEKMKVENIINEKIAAALPVNKVIMSREKAEKTGAKHFFGEKYGSEVSIYFIGDTLDRAYSKEFCGGPHVENTNHLSGPEGNWRFKITKEEAVAQGIRRIKAVLV